MASCSSTGTSPPDSPLPALREKKEKMSFQHRLSLWDIGTYFSLDSPGQAPCSLPSALPDPRKGCWSPRPLHSRERGRARGSGDWLTALELNRAGAVLRGLPKGAALLSALPCPSLTSFPMSRLPLPSPALTSPKVLLPNLCSLTCLCQPRQNPTVT